jgi:hypothetical protein
MLRAFWPKSHSPVAERERTLTFVRPPSDQILMETWSWKWKIRVSWIAWTSAPRGPVPAATKVHRGCSEITALAAFDTASTPGEYARTWRSAYSGVRPVSTSLMRGQAAAAATAAATAMSRTPP